MFNEKLLDVCVDRLIAGTMSEDVMWDMMKGVLPGIVIKGIEKTALRANYKQAEKMYDYLMKDQTRQYTHDQAIAKAAIIAGISPRDFKKNFKAQSIVK